MIARATRFAAALLAAGLWLACGFWTHVPPHERELAPRYSVHAQTDWSARKSGATELWTIHGPSLEALRLTNGLADGKPLAPPHAYKEQMPLFHAAMSGSEVAELVVETLARTGAGNVELQDVSPAPFAGQPGFEIDLSF